MKTRCIGARLTTLALLAGLTVGSAACGFVLTQGPPAGHERMARFTCTESNTGPILDIAYGAVSLLSAAAATATSGGFIDFSAGAPALVGLGAIYTASGIVGLHKTSACRAAIHQLDARQPRVQPAGPRGPASLSGPSAIPPR